MPILIGIFLIIFAAMGVIYFQEQREQNTIQSEIDTLNLQLSHKVEISEKLASDYQAALDAIPIQPVDEDAIRNFKKDVIVAVRNIAELPESDVDIISITSTQTFQPKSIGNSSYQVLYFLANINGDYDKVMAFISSLNSTSTLKTLVLEELNITTSAGVITANLEFGIYTRTE